MMISLFVPVITHPVSLLSANKRLCLCHGIRITLRCLPSFLPLSLSLSLCHPISSHFSQPLLSLVPHSSSSSSFLFSLRHLVFSLVFCPLCAYCRLALDDAIRHKQLNISRFSPRVAGENDFLQTVINKVITAKEVNHKGQGTSTCSIQT